MAMELKLPAVEPQSLKKLSFKTLKRSLDLFSSPHSHLPRPDLESKRIRLSHKLNSEYTFSKPVQQSAVTSSTPSKSNMVALSGPENLRVGIQSDLAVVPSISVPPKGRTDSSSATRSNAVVLSVQPKGRFDSSSESRSNAVVPNYGSRSSRWPKPVWHRPWKNYRVISGHLGWVRSIAFDPSNNWFCTGSADRTIKIWDIASGNLKLTLTGHIQQVRALAVSTRHTYMFSAGDDKLVKCWDLEQNKVIRSYHGHLSGVYCLSLHPTLDILFTGGNDSVCRVWDIRTKTQIHVLSHHEAVFSVFARATDPQVVTGSHDSTIKLWDLRNGKSMSTLTHHKKSVRAMALHPNENCFASASSDSTKKFGLPRGEFLQNMMCQSERKSIINAMAINEDGVVATGGDDGSLWFCDWKSGWSFQQDQTVAQPGSLESEAGIYALSYDMTGTRLVSCEADKSIKMWKEDENATPETHPLNFKPPRGFRRF